MRARIIFTVIAMIAGVAMIVGGPVMIAAGVNGQSQITDQLTAQKIQFPASVDQGLPADLTDYAGQTVTTGLQAKVYADMVEEHVKKATGGLTYSEVSGKFMALSDADKATPAGQAIAGQRQTAFMGESLRGILMSTYQAWMLTYLVMGLGALVTGLAVVLFSAAAVTWPRKKSGAEAPAAEAVEV